MTPYVDGEISDADRRAVDVHLNTCPPCHSRVAAERAVHDLIRARRDALSARCAPEALRTRCAALAVRAIALPGRGAAPGRGDGAPAAGAPAWRARVAPLALAASLVLLVGLAFLYQLTASSSRIMAAELAADHVKCFAMNGVLHTHQPPAAVESAMLSGFGWRMEVPAGAAAAGLELVGSRPCLYGEGKIAHIMYRHRGEPVSLFMLPRESRPQEVVQVLGHRAAIWCDKDRTYVLLARGPEQEIERMAAVVRASLK